MGMLHRILLVSLAAVLIFSSPIAVAQPSDFDLTMSSYIGDSSDTEAVTGIAIQSTGLIVVAANLGSETNAAKNAVLLNGATQSSPGCVLILSSDGKRVISAARIGRATFDLAIDGQDRIWVALGPEGAVALSPDAKTLRHSVGPVTNNGTLRAWMHRVDVGLSGTVALLSSGIQSSATSTPSIDVSPGAGTLIVLDATYQEIGRFPAGHGSDRNALDVVVDDELQMIILVGWKQAFDWFISGSLGGPVQIPWIRAVTFNGDWLWVGYDWGVNPAVGSRYLNEIGVANRTVDQFGNVTVNLKPDAVSNNNMADARLYRASRGEDGNLYVTGHSAGGNHIYRYAPMNNLEAVGPKLANYDFFCSYAGARDQHLGFIARYTYNRTYLIMDGGQGVVARLSAIEPNTLHAEGGAIAGDLKSRIYLGGISAYGLPFWPNEIWSPKPGEQSFNPFGFGDYTGGAFMLAFNYNTTQGRITGRAYCGRVAYGKTKAVAARTFNGVTRVVWGGFVDLPDGAMFTTSDALQNSPGYGQTDAWIAVYIPGQLAPVTAAGEMSTATLDQGPIRVNSSDAVDVRIRLSLPLRQTGLDFDGNPSTVDVRVHYPWSETDPITPEAGQSTQRQPYTYAGTKLYGGLVMDIINLNETVRNHTLDWNTWTLSGGKLRLTFTDAADFNMKIFSRVALFAYTRDLFPGATSTDRFSFDQKSMLSFTFERWVVWNSAYTILMQKRLRFLVREGTSDWFISEKTLGWQGSGPAQWAPHVLSFTGPEDGKWARWTTQNDGLKFDVQPSDFVTVDFRDIQAVGFYVYDDDWFEVPWTKPVPGSNPPVYLTSAQQISGAGSHMRLADFTATLRKNAPVDRLPVASFSTSSFVIRVGDTLTVDASSSYDPDGFISFVSWSFGDATESSGTTETKRYLAAGNYLITVTVYDNSRQTSKASRRVTVLPATSSLSEAGSIAAAWWGQHSGDNNRYMIGDKDALSRQIDNDHQIYLPYAGIERPISGARWIGTKLIGGWRFDTRGATGSFMNDWPSWSQATNNNPSLSPLWDANGVRAGSFGVGYRNIGSGARMDQMFAIDKKDFLNGADQYRVTFDANSRLSCGPFWLIGFRAEQLRFVVRDVDQWFVSEFMWQSPTYQANNANNNGFGNSSATPVLRPNPTMVLENPGQALWAPYDPLSSQFKAPTAGFAPKSFGYITGFGVLVSVPDWINLSNVSLTSTRPVAMEMRAVYGPQSLFAFQASLVLSADSGPNPLQVDFSVAASPFNEVSIREYLWDFNDGVVAVTANPSMSHQYVTPGVYRARVTLTDMLNNQYTLTRQISVLDKVTGQAGSTIVFGGDNLNPYVDEKGNLTITLRRVGGNLESACSVALVFLFDTASPSDVLSVSTNSGQNRISWGPRDAADKQAVISFAAGDGSETLETLRIVLADPFGGVTIGTPDRIEVFLGDEDGSGRVVYDRISNGGVIAGAVVGTILAILALVAIGIFLWKRVPAARNAIKRISKH